MKSQRMCMWTMDHMVAVLTVLNTARGPSVQHWLFDLLLCAGVL